MKKQTYLLWICLVITFPSFSQTKTQEFLKFALIQDSLFMDAYYKRDTITYNQLLKNFLFRYKQIPREDQENFTGNYFNSFYNLSCLYSLLNDHPNALVNLKKSVEAGYMDYYHLQEDTDLDNIRNDEGFIRINNQLKNIGDYLYLLKKGGQYDMGQNRSLPAFTYQSAENADLKKLRETFNLDSIAGEGDDILQVLNLLHWIHKLVPHDGAHDNPVVKNALSMIEECKRDQRGLNCRGLATVLNECYLSMGFKSRIVTCLPKDSLKNDPDCHVINMVYIESLKKWIWIDPTFDAYVMDEYGNLLGIEEVRYRLVNDLPLHINPDANWNNSFRETKEEYLYHYMAKNLYILECPLISQYNMETNIEGKEYIYIRLIPLDYFQQEPTVTSSKNNKSKTTIIKHLTNNPHQFWLVPE